MPSSTSEQDCCASCSHSTLTSSLVKMSLTWLWQVCEYKWGRGGVRLGGCVSENVVVPCGWHSIYSSSQCSLHFLPSELSQLDNEQFKAPRERVTFLLNSIKILTSILTQCVCVCVSVCACVCSYVRTYVRVYLCVRILYVCAYVHQSVCAELLRV